MRTSSDDPCNSSNDNGWRRARPRGGEGRAFLRTGGMWLYVYAESAVRTLLDKVRDSTLLRDLAKERIPLEQAELIGQILSSGHPDTIEGPFITHTVSTRE